MCEKEKEKEETWSRDKYIFTKDIEASSAIRQILNHGFEWAISVNNVNPQESCDPHFEKKMIEAITQAIIKRTNTEIRLKIDRMLDVYMETGSMHRLRETQQDSTVE